MDVIKLKLLYITKPIKTKSVKHMAMTATRTADQIDAELTDTYKELARNCHQLVEIQARTIDGLVDEVNKPQNPDDIDQINQYRENIAQLEAAQKITL